MLGLPAGSSASRRSSASALLPLHGWGNGMLLAALRPHTALPGRALSACAVQRIAHGPSRHMRMPMYAC